MSDKQVVLGFSGLDGAVDFNRENFDLEPGEEYIAQGFDSAAAILVDGKVIAAAAEERFNREKHSGDFPVNAINFCLQCANVSINDVDIFAHGFDYGKFADVFSLLYPDYYQQVLNPERQCQLFSRYFKTSVEKTFFPVEHHLAHAASAYYPSRFTDCLCIVCDGMGEVNSLTVYYVESGNFRQLASFDISDSLGILYGIATRHLGFKVFSDEYKVMGLAPYGNPEAFTGFFNKVVELQENGQYKVHLKKLANSLHSDIFNRKIYTYLNKEILPRRQPNEILEQIHKDFAASLQACLEKTLFHVIDYWQSVTNSKYLCMAGGVALNCTFNGKLIAKKQFKNIYIQAASGDDGTALGAAFYRVAQTKPSALRCLRPEQLPFYGSAYQASAYQAAIGKYADQLSVEYFNNISDLIADAAQAIVSDKIIAWFQDEMEFGPRALGHRSILANPMCLDIKQRLNRIVKLREDFRPFAPAMIQETAADYFDYPMAYPFAFMLATCRVKEQWQNILPGITHVDGSARLQIVSPEENMKFYRLIKKIGELQDIPCVVNTSFNVRGQAIIETPEEAVETFLKVDLHCLYLGNFKCTRRLTILS